jgi:large subunit ribosomal protein L5
MNIPELKKIYTDKVAPALQKSLVLKNVHQVPKVEKVVLNSSFGVELDKNGVEELRKDMTALSGQAPVVVRAKVSVSNFKLREGMPCRNKSYPSRKCDVGISTQTNCDIITQYSRL